MMESRGIALGDGSPFAVYWDRDLDVELFCSDECCKEPELLCGINVRWWYERLGTESTFDSLTELEPMADCVHVPFVQVMVDDEAYMAAVVDERFKPLCGKSKGGGGEVTSGPVEGLCSLEQW